MIRNIKPVKVSPLIKAARWFFLIYGIMYGALKLKSLKLYEEKAKVIREKNLKEKHERLRQEADNKIRKELIDLAKQMELTELPPGWDKDL